MNIDDFIENKEVGLVALVHWLCDNIIFMINNSIYQAYISFII
jgi:hypothetical protein